MAVYLRKENLQDEYLNMVHSTVSPLAERNPRHVLNFCVVPIETFRYY